MKRRDGRKLGRKALEDIRIQAVQQVEAGESPEDVVRTLGFSRAVIYDWIAKYRDGGVDALRAKRATGRPPKLNGKQLKWLYNTITQKNPLQLKFEFALWTRGMIREVIRKQFGVRLSEVSVGRLLKKLGLTPQRPLRRAYQQDPKKVERWLKKEFPRIRALAKKEGATVFFQDEAGVRSDFHAGTTWAPRGQTPVVPATGQRFGLNVASAVSPRGELRFMIFEGRMNGEKFIEFLKRMMHNAQRPIFLIVDGHPSHRARKVLEFVQSTDGWLRLFFLPPYSPELNPDELVWNHLKNHGVGKRIPRSRDELKDIVTRHLRSLQRLPDIVRGFFRQRDVRYAADAY
jgi:transposase